MRANKASDRVARLKTRLSCPRVETDPESLAIVQRQDSNAIIVICHVEAEKVKSFRLGWLMANIKMISLRLQSIKPSSCGSSSQSQTRLETVRRQTVFVDYPLR